MYGRRHTLFPRCARRCGGVRTHILQDSSPTMRGRSKEALGESRGPQPFCGNSSQSIDVRSRLSHSAADCSWCTSIPIASHASGLVIGFPCWTHSSLRASIMFPVVEQVEVDEHTSLSAEGRGSCATEAGSRPSPLALLRDHWGNWQHAAMMTLGEPMRFNGDT